MLVLQKKETRSPIRGLARSDAGVANRAIGVGSEIEVEVEAKVGAGSCGWERRVLRGELRDLGIEATQRVSVAFELERSER